MSEYGENFQEWAYVVKVISGRGFEGNNDKPAVPYWGGDYGDEGQGGYE